jgi:trypsin
VRRLLLLTVLLALCPAAPAAARVMNGDDAGPNDYPWTVALIDPRFGAPVSSQFCGGSLIAPNLVLTAAHCTMGSRADEIDVFAGSRDLNDADDHPEFLYDVVSIRLPAEAEVDPDDQTLPPRNDMSVLVLDAPVPGAQPIAPVPTGTETDWADGDDLEVMGWGLVETQEFPDVLQHATVDRTSDDTCEGVWGPFFSADDMVCALRVAGETVTDTCSGDSGGPLTTHTVGADPTDPADWKLVGTTSFGAEFCDDPDEPGVYARAAAPVLNTFIEDFRDGLDPSDPAPQLEPTGGAPALTGTLIAGEEIACGPGSTTWSDTPTSISARVRVYDPDFDELITVAVDEAYTLRAADVGSQFVCELHARKDGVGGYGVDRTGLSAPVKAAPTTTTTTTTTTVPPPIVIVAPPPPDPQPFVPEPPRDTAAPQATIVSRSCTRARRCTLTIAVADPGFSAGIRSVNAKINFRVRTFCRIGRRIRRCVRPRTRFVAGRQVASQVFVVQTPKLYKGRTSISLTATDVAGNTQAVPTVRRFRLR